MTSTPETRGRILLSPPDVGQREESGEGVRRPPQFEALRRDGPLGTLHDGGAGLDHEDAVRPAWLRGRSGHPNRPEM